MKIIFITAYAHKQGTYFRWHNLALGLKKLGHDVSVFGFDATISVGTYTEHRDGIPYHLIYSSKGKSLFGQLAHPLNILKGLIHPLPLADVYHVFQPFPISCFRGLWHKKRTKALFYDWDDLWYGGLVSVESLRTASFEQKYTHFWTRLLENNMPQWADYTTVCSDFLLQLAKKTPETKVSKIYNGFWSNQIAPDPTQARKDLGLPLDGTIFGFMGRTIDEIEWCFDVLDIENNPTIKLALCGMKEDQLPSDYQKWGNRLIFLGNLTPEKARMFSFAIDFGLLPLKNTNFNQSRFPIKFSEYLAAQKPVVCSEVGEVHMLSKEINGVYLAGKSREEWQSTLAKVMEEIKRQSIQKPSIANVESNLSWDNIASALEKKYRQALQSKDTIR